VKHGETTLLQTAIDSDGQAKTNPTESPGEVTQDTAEFALMSRDHGVSKETVKNNGFDDSNQKQVAMVSPDKKDVPNNALNTKMSPALMPDTLSRSGTSKLSCYFVASSVSGEPCNVFVTSSDVKLAMRNLNTIEDGSLPMPHACHWKCLAIVRGFSCFQHANNFQEAWIVNSTPKTTIRDKVNAASHLTDLFKTSSDKLVLQINQEGIVKVEESKKKAGLLTGNPVTQRNNRSEQTDLPLPNNRQASVVGASHSTPISGSTVMQYGVHGGKTFDAIVEKYPSYINWIRNEPNPDKHLVDLVEYASYKEQQGTAKERHMQSRNVRKSHDQSTVIKNPYKRQKDASFTSLITKANSKEENEASSLQVKRVLRNAKVANQISPWEMAQYIQKYDDSLTTVSLSQLYMHFANTRIFSGEVCLFKIPVQSNLHVSEKTVMEPKSFVKSRIYPPIEDTDIEILGVKEPAGPFINSGEDTFSHFLAGTSNQSSILSSLNPGLELALNTKYRGPVEIETSREYQIVEDINLRRPEEERLVWSWKKGSSLPMSGIVNGMKPLGKNPDFVDMLQPVIREDGSAPMRNIVVETDSGHFTEKVVHESKLEEMAAFVKYCKDPWNERVLHLLCEMQNMLRDNRFGASESIKAHLCDLSLVAQREGLLNSESSNKIPGYVRLTWCNLLNSFLRKDKEKFSQGIREMLYFVQLGCEKKIVVSNN